MLRILLLLFMLQMPFLVGCTTGSLISGHTAYIDTDYPDICDVPDFAEAIATRGVHEGNEKTERREDFKKLEQNHKTATIFNKSLRDQSSRP